MRKLSLQIATLILSLVPLITGVLGLMGVRDPLYLRLGLPADAALDSNLRFLSGVWLALGIGAIWTVPSIERKGIVFRLLWLMIFLGGVGRAISLVLMGLPAIPLVGFTALELFGAPVFVWWHRAIAAEHLSGRSSAVRADR